MEYLEVRDAICVLAVAEEQSFSRAADRCYMSQSALSKVIRKTERNLGVTLFSRGCVPVRLTAEGKLFMDLFRQMCQTHTEIEQLSEEVRRRKKSHLNIAAPSFFCTYVLPEITGDYGLEKPEVNIKVIESNDKEMVDFLKSGICDIGISVNTDMPVDLDYFVLCKENIILAVPRELKVNKGLEKAVISYDDLCSGKYLNEKIPAVPMEKFAKENFLFLRKGNDMWTRGFSICHDAGFEPQISMEFDQLQTAYYLANAGKGVTFIRAGLPYYIGDSGNLNFYKIDHPAVSREVRIYYKKDEKFSKVQEEFLDYLKRYPVFA